MNKWEEKNYTEQEKNCLSSKENAPSGSMNETRSGSTMSEWKDIGGVRKWIRNCPECGVEIQTKNKPLYTQTSGLCKCCAHKKQPRRKKKYTIDELSRKCPKCGDKILHTTLKNCNQAKKKKIICRKCKDTGQFRGNTRPCKNCSDLFYVPVGQSKAGMGIFCSRTCRANYYREASRERMIRTIQERPGQIYPNYNKNACKIIDEMGNKLGFKFQHAENGGEYFLKELGYWVDGYDAEKNVIIEYDEPYHYDRRGKLKQKDVDRMNKIIQHTNCKFYRYNEKLNEVIQYN